MTRDRQASRDRAKGAAARGERAPPRAQVAQQREAEENRARQRREAAAKPPPEQAKRPGLKLSKPVVKSAGANAVSRIVVELQEASGETPTDGLYQFPVYVVTTHPDHDLEVEIEDGAYRDACKGTGTVRTAIIPAQAVGTKGYLRARDLTTGEEIECTSEWVSIGGALLRWLWNLIAGLFRRPGAR